MVKVSILGWGPRVSATTQSEDGLHWGEPELGIVVTPSSQCDKCWGPQGLRGCAA